MERTDETLSTRDLASPAQEPAVEAKEPAAEAQEPVTEAAPAQDDARVARENGGEPAEAPVEPAAGDRVATGDTAAPVDEAGSLLPETEEGDFQRRWEEIQTRFVDDPRQAVEDADTLVASVMQRIAEGFAEARDGLEGQWSAGDDVGTEELRVALQRYRSFFRRLLSA
jgi:hypothetical protein